jgi:hypothetical protein
MIHLQIIQGMDMEKPQAKLETMIFLLLENRKHTPVA